MFSYRDFVYLAGTTVTSPMYQARRFQAADGQLDEWSLADGAFLFAGSGDWLLYATAKDSPPAPTLISAINLTTQQAAPYVIKVAEGISCEEGICPFVGTMAAGQGWAYVGGGFSTNGESSFLRFNVQSGAVEPLHFSQVSGVTAMASDEERVYVGSPFLGTLTAVAHSDVSRVSWSISAKEVFSLRLKSGRLWVAGNFQSIGGVPRKCLAAVDPQTGVVLPETAALEFAFEPSPSLSIVGELGDYLVLYGRFSAVNGLPRNRIVAVHPISGEVHPWKPSIDRLAGGGLTAVVTTDQHVYVAGQFSEIGGLPRQNFAVFDLIAPPEMSAPKLEATGFTSQVKAASTYAHVLQRSPDLGSWENVSTNTPTTAEFTVTDPDPAATERYYRIRLQ